MTVRRIRNGLSAAILGLAAYLPSAAQAGDVFDTFMAAAEADIAANFGKPTQDVWLADLYSRARSQNEPWAWTMLGLLTPKLFPPNPEIWVTVCDYYQSAAEQDYAPAQHLLGDCYKNGTLIDQRSANMMQWYNDAYENGSWTSFCAIGEQLMFGVLLRRDPGRGFKMCEEAADNGAAGPSVTVAEALIGGWAGGAPDYTRAGRYLETALQAGKPKAAYLLAKMHADGHRALRSNAQAAQYAEFAALRGHIPALTLAARYKFPTVAADPSLADSELGWQVYLWAYQASRYDTNSDNAEEAERYLAALAGMVSDATLLNWERSARATPRP